MTIRSTCIALGLLALPGMALADQPRIAHPGFLPPPSAVRSALEQSPWLAEGRANVATARAEAEILRLGPHETVLGAEHTNRRVKGEGEYSEWSLEASRSFRLPGKAGLDASAGKATLEAAANGLADLLHQRSADFADQWVSMLEARERREIEEAEALAYARQTRALSRRVELAHASVLELETAQSAEARARAALAGAKGDEARARALLESSYPGLLPATPPRLPAPEAPAGLDQFADLVVSRSHEIAQARALADREQALSRRARLDRLADPTIGLRTFSERGGEEAGLGLFVSVPFSGPRRSAEADRQAAQATAALTRLALTRRRVAAAAVQDIADIRAAQEVWTGARAALQAAEGAARRTERAYELGESDLVDALAARRFAFEAARAELASRAAAHRAILRLALDAHELWLADEGPDGAHTD